MGFHFCDGSILPVSGNEALYSLLGNRYGGTANVNFALPDLRGRVPVHQGQGNGLSAYAIGTQFGVESVTLSVAQMPSHTHNATASNAAASSNTPNDNVPAQSSVALYAPPDNNLVGMDRMAVASTGGSLQHDNTMPFLGLNFIIATTGYYPSHQ